MLEGLSCSLLPKAARDWTGEGRHHALRNGHVRPNAQTRAKLQRAVQQVDGAGAKSSASRQPHALTPLGLS